MQTSIHIRCHVHINLILEVWKLNRDTGVNFRCILKVYNKSTYEAQSYLYKYIYIIKI